MSNLLAHAEHELMLLRDGEEPDEMQREMEGCITSIIRQFAEQGHSGFSAGYAVSCLEKLLRFEPLRPLTGAGDEWIEVGPGVFQNKRCSHVFKEDGRAYDIDGRVFEEPDGVRFTSGDSRVYVEFPYSPKTEIVKVDRGS